MLVFFLLLRVIQEEQQQFSVHASRTEFHLRSKSLVIGLPGWELTFLWFIVCPLLLFITK